MELHELVYVSLAEWAMSTADLTALLEQAREKNTRLNITGLLVYHRGEFTQMLEGAKTDIFNLYATICEDVRHRAPYVLSHGSIGQRSFSHWSMAFLAPSDQSLEENPAYSSYLDTGLIEQVLSSAKTIGRRMFLISLRDQFLRQ